MIDTDKKRGSSLGSPGEFPDRLRRRHIRCSSTSSFSARHICNASILVRARRDPRVVQHVVNAAMVLGYIRSCCASISWNRGGWDSIANGLLLEATPAAMKHRKRNSNPESNRLVFAGSPGVESYSRRWRCACATIPPPATCGFRDDPRTLRRVPPVGR